MKYLFNCLLLTVISFSSILPQKLTTSSTYLKRTVNLKENIDHWKASVQSMQMSNPGGNSYNDFLITQKQIQTQKYPRKKSLKSLIKSSKIPSFNIENGFEGNLYNNKVPNDNTLAISNDGIILAGINSSYIIYDINNDSLLLSGTLNSLTLDFLNLRFVKKYDPKFIYDHQEDRFIIVFLLGNKPLNSHVCVAFSSTNNPMDDWNVYMLQGDALSTGHWTDYPAISITEDDLFITGNLLLDGVSWQLGFNQSIIWQIDKENGYLGSDSLSFNLWSDIKDDSINIRNIHPVRGARELQDKNQYLLSNKNFSLESDSLYLIKIKNSQKSANSELSIQRISLDDHYFLSPNGKQYNGIELATNDSRVLGGIIDKDWIQFVQHSMDTNYGTAGIYHGIIYNYDVNPYVESKIISDSIIDFGYPNIASTGINPNEKECVIGFNYTSISDTNGVSCVYMNNNEIYSNFTKLHIGNRAIDRLNGNIDRWGDYSGIQRKYDDPCRTWISGMFGKIGSNGSWISSISTSDTCREPLPHLFFEPKYNQGVLFPNPSKDFVNYDFTIEESLDLKISIFSIEGKLVTLLYNDLVNSGPNRLSFDITKLRVGSYLLLIENNEKRLFTKKLIKN
tara:strand:- start:11 stop:1873 length:1863 start_codon:yes stop_codon:yes gene_type:complete